MTSTIRRLVDVADLLGDAPPPHLAAALEERLAGDLAASTQHLHEHHAADPADEPNVAEYLIEAEAQIENADHREAGRVAERLEQILGDDEEVAGWSRLARQPVPTEPDSAAVGSIGWEELTHDLFTNRRGYEIAERFEQLHMHRTITWSGRVTSARDYRIDADFGGDPGVKATIELGKITTHRGYEERVGAVVQLPEDTRLHSGAEVSFSGELIRLDRFARHFYVAGATLE